MGAESFTNRGKGKTARDAFDALVKQARYDHGHAGYTGTIAEKDDFIEMDVPDGMTARDFLRLASTRDNVDLALDAFAPHRNAIERARRIHDDKWGPALCVKVAEDEWAFCGWASS